MKNKSNFSSASAEAVGGAEDFAIRNVRLCGAASDFAETAFAANGYTPDEFAAYITFDMAHTLPGVVLGPVSSGDFIGFLGETLSQSHQRLRRKPLNYRHQMKAYADPKERLGKRDRIIGCILDTKMDPKPMGGWWSPTNPDGADACIHCCAVVFKLADGVDKILGNHLASRETQSVSIEVYAQLDNLSVLRPSTREMHPYLALPEEWLPATEIVKGRARPRIGKLEGEQLIVVYGGGGKPINFRGTAMTPDPAEKFAGTNRPAAEITSVNAEDMDVMAVAAESVPSLLCGQRMFFESTGRYGTVQGVVTEGPAGPHVAKPGNPVLRVALELAGTAWVPMERAFGKFL
jgi:hypothetical protein